MRWHKGLRCPKCGQKRKFARRYNGSYEGNYRVVGWTFFRVEGNHFFCRRCGTRERTYNNRWWKGVKA